jgi:hypothetical protein
MAASESNAPRLVVVSPVEHKGLVFDLSGQELLIDHSDLCCCAAELCPVTRL